MPSKTIDMGLKQYAIGPKLRRLRLRKSMGLVQLAKHTGLSPAMLSKLERGVMHPTLPTLLRIAMVFSVGLDYFFNPELKPMFEIVRRRDRLRFPETPDAREVSYFFENLDFPVANRRFDAYYAQFMPVAAVSARPHAHAGIEFVYVVAGKLLLRVSDEEHPLAAGDAVYFDSSIQHSYRSGTHRGTTALVVTAAAA
ncbi:MAG: XRE family transcriptional regulator [Bryobacteraceae bacterium]|jgi:transcriptional regulator with XRE-family HTH domain